MNVTITKSEYGFANLQFSERPTDQMLTELKSNGWLYSKNQNCWYPGKLSKERNAEASAKFATDFVNKFSEKKVENSIEQNKIENFENSSNNKYSDLFNENKSNIKDFYSNKLRELQNELEITLEDLSIAKEQEEYEGHLQDAQDNYNSSIKELNLFNNSWIKWNKTQNNTQTIVKGYAARLRESFTEKTNQYIGKPIPNTSTGIEAIFSKESQKEIRSQVQNSKNNGFTLAEHFEAAEQIYELFENATLENEHEDIKHNQLNTRMERFLSKPLTLSTGKIIQTCITVKHSITTDGRNIYSIEAMDIKNALEKTRAKGQAVAKAPTLSNSDSLSQSENLSTDKNTIVSNSQEDLTEEKQVEQPTQEFSQKELFKQEYEKTIKELNIRDDIKDIDFAIDAHIIERVNDKTVVVDERFFNKYANLVQEKRNVAGVAPLDTNINLIKQSDGKTQILISKYNWNDYEFDNIEAAKVACIVSEEFMPSYKANVSFEKIKLSNKEDLKQISDEIQAGYKIYKATDTKKALKMLDDSFAKNATLEKDDRISFIKSYTGSRIQDIATVLYDLKYGTVEDSIANLKDKVINEYSDREIELNRNSVEFHISRENFYKILDNTLEKYNQEIKQENLNNQAVKNSVLDLTKDWGRELLQEQLDIAKTKIPSFYDKLEGKADDFEYRSAEQYLADVFKSINYTTVIDENGVESPTNEYFVTLGLKNHQQEKKVVENAPKDVLKAIFDLQKAARENDFSYKSIEKLDLIRTELRQNEDLAKYLNERKVFENLKSDNDVKLLVEHLVQMHKTINSPEVKKDLSDIAQKFDGNAKEQNNAKEEILEPNHSISGKDMIDVINMLSEAELPNAEKEFAKENNKSNLIAEDEMDVFRTFVPTAQYVTTLELIAKSEEKEFYNNKVKELVSKIQNAPKIGQTDGQKEHEIILKYFHPSGATALICEIDKNGDAYGYQVLGGDYQMGEFGYLNINELKNIRGMEVDYYLEDGISIERYLYKESPEDFPEYKQLFENEQNVNESHAEEVENSQVTSSEELSRMKNTLNEILDEEVAQNEAEHEEEKRDYNKDWKDCFEAIKTGDYSKYFVSKEILDFENINEETDSELFYNKISNLTGKIDYGLTDIEVVNLASLYKSTQNENIKDAVYALFEDINYHQENEWLENAQYDKFVETYKNNIIDGNADLRLSNEENDAILEGFFENLAKNNDTISLTNSQTSDYNIEESYSKNNTFQEENNDFSREQSESGRIRSNATSESQNNGDVDIERNSSNNTTEYIKRDSSDMGGDSRGGHSEIGSGVSYRVRDSEQTRSDTIVPSDNSPDSAGQLSSHIEKNDSSSSVQSSNINLRNEQLGSKLSKHNGSIEQLGDAVRVPVLTTSKKQMRDIRAEVKEIVLNKKEGEEWTSAEIALARLYEGGGGLKEKDATSNEVLNAFYTPYPIINSVWKLADSYAPNAETVLEPSSGIGRFADNRPYNTFTLHEIDETSSTVAKVLHPDANIIKGAFQEQFFDETNRLKIKDYQMPKYDVVIGNPPYGDYNNEWSGRGEGAEHTRYDQYFIEKALDSLKDENSIVAFVIPSGTLRTGINKGKQLIASKGVLLDAYRLPNKAFSTTDIGTDIVIFKKGAMDVNRLCGDDFFKNHPEKVLGEKEIRSNRFGEDEEYISIPEGETLETLLTKIDEDIKNRGIDLNLIQENKAKAFLAKKATENVEEKQDTKVVEKSNIEKELIQVIRDENKDFYKVVDLYNEIAEKKVSRQFVVNKNLIENIKEDKRRSMWIQSYYDIETKNSFVTFESNVLATIDNNGIVTNTFSDDDFKKLSNGKQESILKAIQEARNNAAYLKNNLLGIYNNKYYFKNAEGNIPYSFDINLFDSKENKTLSGFLTHNCVIPAICARKNNLKKYNYSDFRSIVNYRENPRYSSLYSPELYYPTFESLYPENGKIDFAQIIDDTNQNELKIEEFKFDKDYHRTHSWEENNAYFDKFKEKLQTLIFDNSKISTPEEFIEKATEENDKILDEQKQYVEKIKAQNNVFLESQKLYGKVFDELKNVDFSNAIPEQLIDGYLVEVRKDKNISHIYIDQKRKCSIEFKGQNKTLITYNNEALPVEFVRNLFIKNGSQLSVKDVSPFREEVLSLDKIIKENITNKPDEKLADLSEKVLANVLSDKDFSIENENVITGENHTAKIIQNGTIKKAFFDNSNYAAFEYNSITQSLKINNETLKINLQNVIFEKAKEFNPEIKITRDFIINKVRYIDSDGKTKIAAAESPRYNPEREVLLNNKDFAALYGASWKEEERIFFEVSDGFGGYVNLNRLTLDQQKLLRSSKNYVEEYPNKFIHKEFYTSGNVYNKLDKLDNDFAEGILPVELYEKNKVILEKAIPAKVTNAEISILSATLNDFEIDGVSIKDKFFTWATRCDLNEDEGSHNSFSNIEDFSISNVKREDIPSTITWKDVYDYAQGVHVSGNFSKDLSEKEKKQIRKRIQNDRKAVCETLFTKFLKEGLTQDEKDVFWNHYNKVNHAIKSPDWSKLPLYIDGMNQYRKGKDFKLFDQQIKGVSFLCNKGNGLLAYDVGVGKTAAGIVATVNQIQTAKSKRPLIIVPKTVISQWESDIHELFPDVQVNNLDNLSGKSITEFYDGNHGLNIPEGSITLVTKEALNNISFKETTRDEMFQDFVDLTGVSANSFAEMSDKEKEDYKNTLKDLFGQAESIEDENFVFWENCGFDNLTVDEAHYYKNLFKAPRTRATNNEFEGIGQGKPSKRAVKMFVMTQQIQKANKGRNVFLLTATPFTNSPSEIYSMLTYIAREEMQKQGVKNFYDFCTKYIKTQYEPIVKANGEIEYSNVIKSFNELDGLQNLLNQFIDKVDGEEAGIIRPNKHTLLAKMEATPVQKEIFDFCTNVIMEYNPKADKNPKHDDDYKRRHSGAILEAINIMRTACLSPALVNPDQLINPYTEKRANIILPEISELVECSPKLKLVCDTVVKNWKENKTQGQLIFMPQGTKYYDQVISYMEKQGVPKEVFATIDGSKSTIGGKTVHITKDDDPDEGIRTKVASAFNDVKNPAKILIGSDSIKEGINLNGNSIALYNTMLGWNPSDAIQAEGRIWRQGNLQGDVNIVYPLIYNSVDSLIYQKYDEKKSRVDALWRKVGEGEKIDISEINPADLKYDLIKDPVKRARLEVNEEKEKVKAEILNLRNAIINFENYNKKIELLKSSIEIKKDAKKDYVNNYKMKLLIGEAPRTAEEQKEGEERYDKSIAKVEDSIKLVQKKIFDELNKGDKNYTKENFIDLKNAEIDKLTQDLKHLDSDEVMKPIIEKYQIKLAEEAVLNLSAEERNPLDKRIQGVLRPAYFTQWERKNERFEELLSVEQNKLEYLQNNPSENKEEIEDSKKMIEHLKKENKEFREDWNKKYGNYETALEDWNKNHIEIKIDENAPKVKVEEVENIKPMENFVKQTKEEVISKPINQDDSINEKVIENKISENKIEKSVEKEIEKSKTQNFQSPKFKTGNVVQFGFSFEPKPAPVEVQKEVIEQKTEKEQDRQMAVLQESQKEEKKVEQSTENQAKTENVEKAGEVKNANEPEKTKTSENELELIEIKHVDLRNDKSFSKIDFNFKGIEGFSINYLKKCNYVPPFKVSQEDEKTVLVMGENKTEYTMTQKQLAYLVENGNYYAKTKENVNIADLANDILEPRKKYLNNALTDLTIERKNLLRAKLQENNNSHINENNFAEIKPKKEPENHF